MGSFNFRCVCCQYPILRGMECVGFWIEQGVRRDDLMIAGTYDDSFEIEPSEITNRFMTEEELKQRLAEAHELWEKNRLKWYNDEKEVNTGISLWHRHCFEEEIDIEPFVNHKLHQIEHQISYWKDPSKTTGEYHIEELEEEKADILKQKEHPLGSDLLRRKAQYYSLLEQNIVSQSGQFFRSEAVQTMVRHLENLQKFKYVTNPAGGKHYLETPEYIHDEDKFIELLVDLEIPSDWLEKAAAKAKEKENLF